MNEKSIKFVVLGDIGKELLFWLAAALLTSRESAIRRDREGNKNKLESYQDLNLLYKIG